MRSKFLVLFLLCTTVYAKAQQKYELTVQQAVELAYKNVVELRNAQLDYQIQQSKNQEIFGQALPQISGSAGLQHYLQLPKILFPDASQAGIYSVLIKEGILPQGTVIPSPVVQQVSFQQPWNTSVGATLTQLLFQPDVFVGLQARQTALNLSKAQVEAMKEKVKDSAYKKYYAILIAQKQLEFLQSSVERIEKLYKEQTELYKNGFIERLDLDKVEVQLNNLKTTASVVENAVRINYGILKLTLNINQKDTVILKDELSVDQLKQGVLEEGFVYDNRPEIRSLQYLRDLNKLDVKRYKMGYIPTLAAQVNYSITGQGQNFITDKNATTWIRSSYIGLSLNLPIFDGFQRREKIKQANLNLQKTENQIEQVKNAIDFEQFAYKESLKNALLNLDAQVRNMNLAKRVYETTLVKYQQGLGSSVEMLLAEGEFQNAQNNYFNALYNAIVSKISYQRSLGKLQ